MRITDTSCCLQQLHGLSAQSRLREGTKREGILSSTVLNLFPDRVVILQQQQQQQQQATILNTDTSSLRVRNIAYKNDT